MSATNTATEAQIAAMFAGADDAPGEKLPFLPIGQHKVKITDLVVFESSKKKGVPGVRVNVEVVETDSPETAPGNRHVIVHQKAGAWDYWLTDSKALVAAAKGKKSNEVNQAEMVQFVSAFKTILEKVGAPEVTVQTSKESGGAKGHFFKNVYSPA